MGGPILCPLHDTWEAPSRLSLASVRGGHLLIAAGRKLHALIVEEESGKIFQVQSVKWDRQLSAIAQVGVRLAKGGGREFRLSAIGSWEDNRVTLCRSGELSAQPLGYAELPHGQARSIAVADFGGDEVRHIPKPLSPYRGPGTVRLVPILEATVLVLLLRPSTYLLLLLLLLLPHPQLPRLPATAATAICLLLLPPSSSCLLMPLIPPADADAASF
jgi:hypothetical protein